ncbi:glutathione S-transferase theta-1-like isoform X1 [Balaenoptera musculus]|uniref:glutathione transferase n=2 Tax=Balaenoptera musculus TaxID=9771 RepID=A0A8B8ZER3_BALMU|nr:glutathione S-transferase theta-1-like isoform X1 [Balaenoptera musculus]
MGSYQGDGPHCCSSDPALGLLCSVSLALRGWSTPAMGLELYLDLLSQPCRAVYIFAKKNGIPFELCSVDLRKVWPSCSTWPASIRSLTTSTPRTTQACAHVDEYLAWQHTTLQRNCLRLLWHKVMLPVYLGEPVSPEMLTAMLAELDMTLQVFEDKFLQNKAFLAGPHISLADLLAITELMHPVGAGCQVFEGRPKLAAWHQRVEAAVGEVLFQEAHEVILKAKDSQPADPTIKRKLMSRVLSMIQ